MAGMSGLPIASNELHGRTVGQAAADLWNNLFADNASTFTIEVESKGVAVVSAIFAKPIGNWIDIALELGELFSQLRAAPDGAAFELATLLSAPHSPTDESRLYFPVYAKPKYFVDSAFNKNPFPQELKQSQVASLLKLINDLASKDRHRRLHVIGVTPTDIGGHIEIGSPGRITFTEAIPCNFFEGTIEISADRIREHHGRKTQGRCSLDTGDTR